MRYQRPLLSLGLVAVLGLAGCGSYHEKPASSGDPILSETTTTVAPAVTTTTAAH
jgi:hypothetical protein